MPGRRPGCALDLAHLVPAAGGAVRLGLRSPLLHFLAIGGVLFGLDARLEGGTASEPGLPAALSDEELLYREARTLGLHRSDPLVRRRLVRNMRFVTDDPDRGDDALFAEALALGMDESDLVVRRRLVQTLVLALQASARRQEPTEGELTEWLERHPERFARPARVRLSHVFLSRGGRGAALRSDARTLLDELVRSGAGPERADERGDPLPLPVHLPPRSEAELAATFGMGFAREVLALEPGAWAGPIASSYGLHLVWVHEHRASRPAELGAVRSAVREALLEERAAGALQERLAWLRAGY